MAINIPLVHISDLTEKRQYQMMITCLLVGVPPVRLSGQRSCL